MSDSLQLVNSVLIGGGANSAATQLPSIEKGDLLIFDEIGNAVDTVAKATSLSKFSKIQIASL